ncbi:MAG TPA: DUF3426 domain-containing protein [Pseudomonadales bacterium]
MAEESLEPLITQCPTCRTRFRVSEAQLEVAAGRVRCGACLSVFTGLDHLELGSGARLRPGENVNEALDALLEELRTDPSPSADSAANPTQDAPTDESAEVSAESAADDPAAESEFVEESLADTSPAPATTFTRRERQHAAQGHSTDGPTAGRASAALDIDPEELIRRPLRRRRRWWVPVVLVLGIALLAAQVLYFQFDAWAKNPQFRPLYEWLCTRLSCELPVMRSLASIYSKNLVVRAHPDTPGTLLVDAVVVNQAPFPQPFPVIELRFSSRDGSLIAARQYRPEEYLAGELAGASMMAALTPIHIAFNISDPGTEAVNYVLVFR